VRGGASWSEEEKLTAFGAAADDRFGSSVSISGDAVLAGAPFDDDDGTVSGSAYAYLRGAPIPALSPLGGGLAALLLTLVAAARLARRASA
jgi:hypothetical protein